MWALSRGTVVVILSRAASEKVNVNKNTVKEDLVTGSRKTRAMMRGVSAALASWTATSSAEQTKTMDVNSDDAMVPSTARAVSGCTGDSQLRSFSIQCRRRTVPIAATAPRNGKIQIELAR